MVSTARHLPSHLLPRRSLPSHVSEVWKEDTDLGHRGYEKVLKTRWQDGEMWHPFLNPCQDDVLRLRMTGRFFLWSLCKHLIVTVQVSVTISLGECPQRYCYPFLERFYHCYATQRRLLPLKDYSNSFFWYFPYFVEEDSNYLAIGYKATLVAYPQPLHKCIINVFVCFFDSCWFLVLGNTVWRIVLNVCLFLLRGRVMCAVSFWHSLQQWATFRFAFFVHHTFSFLHFYPLIPCLTKKVT